jgi:hypothetical protein
MTREWKAASESGRQPRWDIFTDTYIKQACDQVATSNPDWHADLFATDLSRYMTGATSKKMWWVLPGARSSAVQEGDDGA